MTKSNAIKDWETIFQSIENQSYSAGIDDNADLSRVYVALPHEEFFTDEEGKMRVPLLQLIGPMQMALMEILEGTQGTTEARQLVETGGDVQVVMLDGSRRLVSTDSRLAELVRALNRIGEHDA